MANTDIRQTTTTGLKTGVPDYKVSPQTIDEAGHQKETYYQNPNFTKYLGYYKTIPELKQAVDALARWTAGRGWTSDDGTRTRLERIKGWGEDTFDSILWNLLVMKKINGDSYAEIIRWPDNGDLINLKPLNPQKIQIVVNSKGVIERYEELDTNGKAKRKFKPDEIYCPWNHDSHQDHRAIAEAVIATTRKNDASVYMYEQTIPGGITPYGFKAQKYIDISNTFDKKIKSLEAHKSQIDRNDIK